VIDNSAKNKKTRYWLLTLKPKEGNMTARGFGAGELERATSAYIQVEKTLDESSEAVLVSVESLSSLRAAYPSYFADTHAFLGELSAVLAT
jgi:hypothetical protein